MRIALAVPLLLPLLAAAPRRAIRVERPLAVANDYQRSAGVLSDGVLSVRLVAQRARWRPADEGGVALPADALGEEGKAPSVPGPLLRAPVGTRVRATIRNTLPETLVVSGLRERGPGSKERTVTIAPGAARPIAFTINVPGAYVYFGELHDSTGNIIPGGRGTQLVGMIIGDTSTTVPHERVMAMGFWNRLIDSTAKKPEERPLFILNGKIWPYTPRFTFQVGDTVRWRVVDFSLDEHPMHLHGFYFRVDSRGSFDLDSAYTADQRRLAVTESTQPFGNFTITWVPERAGNWIFHCHKPAHTSWELRHTLDNTDPPEGPQQMRHDASHAEEGMSGLVVAITVVPRRGGEVTAAGGRAQSANSIQRVRVLAQERAGFYGDKEGLGYVMAEGSVPPMSDSIRIPGVPIVLTRGVPAEVTVVNRMRNATTVHWHGIELESFYDGVAGWSGAGNRVAPMIAPGDSFVARFTPPRPGTFIYHTHHDDMWQMERGLYAPLIVLEPGEHWDPDTDHVLMIGPAFERREYVVVLNGSTSPRPLQLNAEVRHRFRVINMTIDEAADLSWLASADSTDSTLVMWRAVAKDGAALPDRMATERPAKLHVLPGETYDFVATPKAGESRVRVKSANVSAMRVIAR